MEVYAHGKRIQLSGKLPDTTEDVVVLVSRDSLRQDAEALGMSDILQVPVAERAASRFERRVDHERLLLYVPLEDSTLDTPPAFLGVYYAAHWMVWVYDEEVKAVQRMRRYLAEDDKSTPGQALAGLLGELTAGDEERLEDMEESIATLEEAIADGTQIQYTTQIGILRRQLLRHKRYYESLMDALDDLEENPSGYWNAEQLAHFHLLTARAERLFRTVLNLRDYVTQVREAYQAQMDISMNSTMKLFTVLTAVFSPLSLLVGWFGMNLQMPEYTWIWGYPIVITLALVIVIACIVVFRRRGWF